MLNRISCPEYTSNNQLNFFGAFNMNLVNYRKNCSEKTIKEYLVNVERNIAPYIDVNRPISEYTYEYTLELLLKIQEVNGYKDVTKRSRLNHLILNPIKFYLQNCGKSYDEWVNPHVTMTNNEKEIIQQLLPRSLTSEQETKICLIAKDKFDNDGRYCATVLMYGLGTRESETAQLRFQNIKKLGEYDGEYYIEVIQSAERNTRKTKVGTKSTNGIRRMPIPELVLEFLMKRIQYINSIITFPYIEDEKVYHDIGELPIVCNGQRFGRFCTPSEISEFGGVVLRELEVHDDVIESLNLIIRKTDNSEFNFELSSPTMYLLRRNFATKLEILSFPLDLARLLMGHRLEEEDNTSINRRILASDEFLHECLQRYKKDLYFSERSNFEYRIKNNTVLEVNDVKEVKVNVEITKPCLVLVTINSSDYDNEIVFEIDGKEVELEVIEQNKF